MQPLFHAVADGAAGARIGQDAADDSDGVRPSLPAKRRIFERDASDSDQRPAGERAYGAQAFDADGRIGPVFRRRTEDRAKCHVVDRFGLRGSHLLRIVRRKPDHGFFADDFSRIGRQKILLPEVQACLEKHSVIGAVVHDEQRGGVTAKPRDLSRLPEHFAAPEAFMPELQNTRAALQKCRGRLHGIDAQTIERCRVDDRVNGRKWPGPQSALSDTGPGERLRTPAGWQY